MNIETIFGFMSPDKYSYLFSYSHQLFSRRHKGHVSETNKNHWDTWPQGFFSQQMTEGPVERNRQSWEPQYSALPIESWL